MKGIIIILMLFGLSARGQDVYTLNYKGDTLVCILDKYADVIERYAWIGWQSDTIIQVKDSIIGVLGDRNLFMSNLVTSYQSENFILKNEIESLNSMHSLLQTNYSESIREYGILKDERDLYKAQIKEKNRERYITYGIASLVLIVSILATTSK
jgi:hypothetical protein